MAPSFRKVSLHWSPSEACDRELKEIDRVLKPGGYNVVCPGEEKEKRPDGLCQELRDRGFEYRHYVSGLGCDVYNYWKQKAA